MKIAEGAATSRHDFDGLVALAASARTLEAEYGHYRLDVPAWLKTARKKIDEAIADTRRDLVARKRAELERAIAGTETPTERRERLQRELAALDNEVEAIPVS